MLSCTRAAALAQLGVLSALRREFGRTIRSRYLLSVLARYPRAMRTAQPERAGESVTFRLARGFMGMSLNHNSKKTSDLLNGAA